MKPYPAYKDSGVEWIGEVPVGWEVTKLRFILDRNDGGVWGEEGTDQDIPVLRSTELNLDGSWSMGNPAFRKLTQKEFLSAKLLTGDLLVTKSSGSEAHIGKTGIVTNEVEAINPAFSNFMQRLRVNESHFAKVYFYFLNNYIGREQLNYFSSTTTGLKNLNASVLGDLVIPSPPLAEQTAIAAYLDRKTAQIDSLIERKRRLITLLQEERTAVISHAVTKGLNPAAPMQDSGVEWIGEVPEGWKVKRIKYVKKPIPNSFVDGPFGSNLKSIHYVIDGDVYVVESGFVTSGHFVNKEFKTITKDHYETIKRSTCEGGDVVIAKIGAYFGMSGILPLLDKPAVVSGNSLKLTVDNRYYSNQYIHIALLTARTKGAFNLIVNATAQPALSLGELNNLAVPSPPIEEQKAIVAYLDEKTTQIDQTIARTERQIELLQEYRTALISAAVTGKIDVRTEAAL